MEIEIKFSPVSSTQARLLFEDNTLTQPAGELQRYRMETTYYDDPMHILSQNGFTFRLRQENEICICTFKTRLTGLARLELEAESENIEDGAKLLLQNPALPEKAREALARGQFIPTCGASFVRLAQMRQTAQLTAVLSWDAGILFNGDVQQPFTEAELELAQGEENALAALAEQYERRFDLALCTRSKQQRARALGRNQKA